MPTVAVIGGGPAGLFAAERLAAAGCAVTVYEKMPSMARRFLMAGRGGLNLTHSEPMVRFSGRYGQARAWMQPRLDAYPPAALVAWAEGLGQPMFTGSSGRVFPSALKASPLLRAWLARLAQAGVTLETRCEWQGWDGTGALVFATPDGATRAKPDAAILTLGGASWPRLGADGAWTSRLDPASIAPLRPANMGVDIAWSPVMQGFAGQPLKGIALSVGDVTARGEAMVTRYGLEGGAVYALSARLRDAVGSAGAAALEVDLRPDIPVQDLAARLARPRGAQSLSNHLRKTVRLSPLEINLLREAHGNALPAQAAALAAAIRRVPLTATGVQGLERAISTAGGVRLDALDERQMLIGRPGVFCAGEMLDWEAPTGGYLLQGCFATGLAAAEGVLAWLAADGAIPPPRAPGPATDRP